METNGYLFMADVETHGSASLYHHIRHIEPHRIETECCCVLDKHT